jgi:hypothetical protein
MIKVIWQPTWEAAELLLANPDFKAYVDSYENADNKQSAKCPIRRPRN